MVNAVCDHCTGVYTRQAHNQRFCDALCTRDAQNDRNRELRKVRRASWVAGAICDHCGGTFLRRVHNQRFCAVQCQKNSHNDGTHERARLAWKLLRYLERDEPETLTRLRARLPIADGRVKS